MNAAEEYAERVRHSKEAQQIARQRVLDALARRRESGLTLMELGLALGVSPSTVHKWADGQIPDGHLSMIALILDLDRSDLPRRQAA